MSKTVSKFSFELRLWHFGERKIEFEFKIRGWMHSVTKESLARLSQLSECRNNINPYQLQTCHVSQLRGAGTVRECELIVNRSGLQLDLSSDQLE